jgi:hypothetical protein
MNRALKKRLALAAFILMLLSLAVTAVRPRIPGSQMSRAEMIGVAIQIVLAVVAFRTFRSDLTRYTSSTRTPPKTS